MTQNSAPEEWSAPAPNSAGEDRFAAADSPPSTIRTRKSRLPLSVSDATVIQPGGIPAAAGLNPTQHLWLRLTEGCVLASALMSLGFLCWALWGLSGFFGETLAWSGTGFVLLPVIFLSYATFCRFTTLRMTALGAGAHLALVTLIYGLFAFLQMWAMANYRFGNSEVWISMLVSVVALLALMSASRATRWHQRRIQYAGSIANQPPSATAPLPAHDRIANEPGWGANTSRRKFSGGRRSNKGKAIFMQIAALFPLVIYGAWLLIVWGDQALFYGDWRPKLLWCGLLLLVSVYIYGQFSRFWTARIFGYGASIAVGYFSFLGFSCAMVMGLMAMNSGIVLDNLMLAGFLGLIALVSIGCSYAAAWRIGSHITAEIQRHIPLESEEDSLVEGGSWDEAKPAG